MEPHIKDRIIGIGVLAFTVAISLPWFIEHMQGNTEFSEPEWPQMALSIPSDESQNIQAQVAQQMAAAPAPTVIPEEAPATIEQPLPAPAKGFSVQLATFTKAKNAQDLENKLRTAGYAVYTVQSKGKNGNLIKVLVGPHLKKSDAEKAQSAIETTFHVKGFVVAFDPVNA